jgi:anthranilate synthase component I
LKQERNRHFSLQQCLAQAKLDAVTALLEFVLPLIALPHQPDLLALAAADPKRYPALLQTLGSDPTNTKAPCWDLLAISNGERILAVPERAFLSDLAAMQETKTAAEPSASSSPDLPFLGGWIVYLGYEIAAEIEPKLALPAPKYRFPNAFALRTPGVIAIDRSTERAYLVCEAGFETLFEQTLAALAQSYPAITPCPLTLEVIEDTPEQFIAGVKQVQDYLVAGDVFQVNLSRAWQAKVAPEIRPAQLYANLCASNPAPFAALLQLDQFAVISSSPERLIGARDGIVQTRPIAGTRARASTDAPLSAAEKSAFIGDLKERAEHIMLIDLERNDLGRVCVAGTVEVDELLSVESYAHVHHLVSNVRGKLRPGIDPVTLLKAVFPGGTITGCPKVRCMQIIAELEAVGRGPYTGALGYIGSDGRMDFNILIRTLAMVDHTLYFRAGAGIVMDSNPEKELLETRAKAKGMLQALC